MINEIKKMTYDFLTKEKIVKDIEILSSFEESLFPKNKNLLGLDYKVFMYPAEVIGGDCYDILNYENTESIVYLSDVTGHGIPAGIIVGIMNSLVYTLSNFYKTKKEILVAANKILHKKTKENMFVTTVMCSWNPFLNRFSYIQAGHQKIIHYKAKEKKAYLCEAGGLALGIIEDISFALEEKSIFLEKDDVVYLYSDGITELWTSETEMLGVDQFMDIINKYSMYQSSEIISSKILNELWRLKGDMKQEDDITLMVFKKT